MIKYPADIKIIQEFVDREFELIGKKNKIKVEGYSFPVEPLTFNIIHDKGQVLKISGGLAVYIKNKLDDELINR